MPMKKQWIPILFLAISLALGVLSVQGTASPDLRSESDSYAITAQSMVFTISNNSSRGLFFAGAVGDGWFEAQTDNGWEKRTIQSRPDIILLAVQITGMVPPKSATEIKVGLSSYRDDAWESGTYRFVLPYSYGSDENVYKNGFVLTSNEFVLE